MVGDVVALGYGSTVTVYDPEHGCDRRLGSHRAPDRHVPVSDVR